LKLEDNIQYKEMAKELVKIVVETDRRDMIAETFVLIVILPNSAGQIRNAVKHWGDVKYGTLSVSVNMQD
jgi:hypothetical protein